MDVHKNARTTPYSRALIAARIQGGERVTAVAAAFGVCERTARKWARRAAEGTAALEDRSCRPHHSPRAISAPLMVEIQRLRRRRWPGVAIAEALGISRATVSRMLQRLGLARLRSLNAPATVQRYEWPRPGQLLHLDTKTLGRIRGVGHRITGDRRHRSRGAGWEVVHVCVDDCSRAAYAEVLPTEHPPIVAAFVRRAIAWFARHGIRIERVLTDNGNPYRSHLFAALCRVRAITHRRTRPYTPRTNGKAERFIQTLLREWAYAQSYETSRQRTAALAPWLHYYNWHRRHGSLGRRPPISRCVRPDDLLRLHT